MARPVYDSKLRKVIFHSHKDYEDTLSVFQHFRGYYSLSADLPTIAEAGDFAVVGQTDTMWVYDGETLSWKNTGSTAGVLSFNGRLGVVMPQANDYTWAQIDKTSSNLSDIATRNFSDLQNIPSEFTPAAHNHSASDINSGNLDVSRLPIGGTWTLTSPLNINDQDIVLNRKLQIFSSYSNMLELKNTSSVSLATFLVENNIGISRALKILNSGSAYAGTGFLNDYAGIAITEPNATCIANTYTGAPLYFGVNNKAVGVLYNDYVGLGLFNVANKPTSLLHLQPLRDASENTIVKIGDTRAGNTSDAFRFIAQNDGGRLLIYNLGTAKIDLRAGGNSDISPAGYLTVNPANDLRVSSNTIFNYDYADRDFTIRKLTSGVAYNYDAGLDQHTWYAANYFLQFTGGSGIFGISHNNNIQYAQFGNQGFGIVDGVNNLTAAYGVQNIRYINSTSDYWFGLYYQEFIFNSIYSDVDFVINKYNSGIAYKYDSGDDIHKWGNADLLTGAPSAKYLFTEGNLTVQNETTGNTYLIVQNLWSGTRYSGGMSINGIEFRIGLGDYPRTIDIYGTTQNHLMFTSGRTIFNNSNLDQDFIIKKLTSGNALVYDAGLDKFSFSSHLENSEDIKVSNASKGLILIDRTTSNAYRLYINNGVLYQEAI